LPVTEETPLDNSFWEYSRNKIACEKFLRENAARYGIKYTIVRPSHTYDKTLLPFDGGYTVIKRMLDGKPVVVLGDGTSIWTLTHHKDFAVGLVGLLNNPKAMDEVFQITSDEWLSWNQIYLLVGNAFGVVPQLVHIPSEIIAQYHKEIGDGLLGDKSHSMIFDNTKIKAAVPEFNCKIPFSEGVNDLANWYKGNLSDKTIDSELDKLFNRMIEDISSIQKQ